jgi:hypothetical protein
MVWVRFVEVSLGPEPSGVIPLWCLADCQAFGIGSGKVS